MKSTAGTLVTRIDEIQEHTNKEYNSEERPRGNEINRRNFSYED